MTMTGSCRSDISRGGPLRLPGALARFEAEAIDANLPVGAPGKVGALDLSLSSDGRQTSVERQFQRAPLHLYRPLYLDSCRPGMAYLYLQQFGDGLVQGDRLEVNVHFGPGSEAHLTTQASTKIFTARQNFASQSVNLRIDEGAFVEYLPDPVVPFRGSRFFQRTNLSVHRGATLVIGETVLPGRVAYGERHLYDVFWSDTEARDDKGCLLFKDLLRLEPGAGGGSTSLAILGPYDIVASFFVITRMTQAETLPEVLRDALAEWPRVLAGVSRLPNGAGVGVRLLGSTSADIRAGMKAAWSATRLHLLGGPVPDLRKG